MESNYIISLALIFSSSIAGSFHCGAMCGTFACLVSQNKTCRKGIITNPAYYHLGRLITYVLLTVLFFLGIASISNLFDSYVFRFAILAICVLILLYDLAIEFPKIGLFLKKHVSFFTPTSNIIKNLITHFSNFLARMTLNQSTHTSPISSFVLGMVTGLIPCSWLYIYLAMAGSQETLLHACLLIFSFWLGTIPILFIIGRFGSILAFSLFPKIKYISRTLLICATILTLNMRTPLFSLENKKGCALCITKNPEK